MEPVRTGVLGCGEVSEQYLPIITKLPYLDVVAAADVVPARARQACEHYAVPVCTSPEKLLADPDIELILNLTPIPHHFDTTAAALAGGKHVYSEKSLATSTAQARELVQMAGRAGQLLACAPDTLLGTGFSAARQSLDRGDIGLPLSATACLFRPPLGPVADPQALQLAFYDMAPYFLTALVDLLGPARQIAGFAGPAPANGLAGPEDGAVRGDAVIEFDNGIRAQLSMVWGTSYRGEVPFVAVFGSAGELRLPNPNAFGGPALVRGYGEQAWRELPGSRQAPALPANLRGLGVADLARAIREKRSPAASGEIAAHVVEIIEQMLSSAHAGRHLRLSTNCCRAVPLHDSDRAELLGGLTAH